MQQNSKKSLLTKSFTIILAVLMVSLFASVLVGCEKEPPYIDGPYIVLENRFYSEHLRQFNAVGVADGAARRGVRPQPTVRVPLNPTRVGVMCHAILDIFYALEVQDNVAAISHLVKPTYLENVFGGNRLPNITLAAPHDPDYEAILDLDLDLIIISARQRAGRDQSNHFARLSLIAPTIDLGASTGTDYYIQEIIQNVTDVSRIFEIEESAAAKIAALNKQTDAVNALAAQLNASALVVQLNINAISVFGSASRYSFVHREFGIREAAQDGINSQQIANANNPHGTDAGIGFLQGIDPDIIFVIDRGSLTDGIPSTVNIFAHQLFSGMSAVSNNLVFTLSADVWYMVMGGFHGTQMQVAEIMTALQALYNSRK